MTSNHPLATRSPHSVGVVVRLAFVLLGLSQANAQPKKQPEQAQAKRNKASVDMRLFIAVRRQWEELALRDMISRNPQIPLPPGRKVEPITKKELAEAEQQLAKRCLTLSEKYPGTSGELGALYLAASRTGDTKHGVTARKKLVSRFATTKLEDFQKVIRYAGTSMVLTQQFIDGRRKIFESIAPELLKKVRKDPKQPAADVLLTRVCTYTTYPHREEVPQFFTPCAELIIEHHAGSAEITISVKPLEV